MKRYGQQPRPCSSEVVTSSVWSCHTTLHLPVLRKALVSKKKPVLHQHPLAICINGAMAHPKLCVQPALCSRPSSRVSRGAWTQTCARASRQWLTCSPCAALRGTQCSGESQHLHAEEKMWNSFKALAFLFQDVEAPCEGGTLGGTGRAYGWAE